jgi:hypothetical protein
MLAATTPPAWAAAARDMSADAHQQAGGGRTLGPDGTFSNADFGQLSGYSALLATRH